MNAINPIDQPFNQQDLTGKKHGRLTALKRIDSSKWLFRCECGKEKPINIYDWRKGSVISCGCRYKETNNAITRHGMSLSREYNSWNSMMDRCTNPNGAKYPEYGARGIKVCERWRLFDNFLADMGPRPAGTSLDRFPGQEGDYEPGNCRWATPKQQARNRCSNALITYNGETKTASEWAEIVGITRGAFYRRWRTYGWSMEEIMQTKPGKPRRSKGGLSIDS